MLIKILVVVAVLLAVLLLIASFQPDRYQVSRSITIATPPAAVFAQVNDLNRFQTWNPWATQDPEIKGIYEGPQAGVGAAYAWASRKVGEGKMTIVESVPDRLVRLRLDFIKPLSGTSDAQFQFQTDGETTRVTWQMEGQKHFMAKLVGIFVSMDRMIGVEFERGLFELKKRAEHARLET